MRALMAMQLKPTRRRRSVGCLFVRHSVSGLFRRRRSGLLGKLVDQPPAVSLLVVVVVSADEDEEKKHQQVAADDPKRVLANPSITLALLFGTHQNQNRIRLKSKQNTGLRGTRVHKY